jgi:hypothetical protein
LDCLLWKFNLRKKGANEITYMTDDQVRRSKTGAKSEDED